MTTHTRSGLQAPQPHLGPLISSYQDGLTTDAENDLVERHLLGCEVCRAYYAGLQEARTIIGDLPAPPAASQQLPAAFDAIQRRIIRPGRGRGRKG